MTRTTKQTARQSAGTEPGTLRRELKITDAAAFSAGLIGPVGAMALLGVGAAGILGRGATLAFVFALVGVALVAYAFVRLSRYIAHTGSVYALVGVTLGPRAGFVAGWSLFAAYLTIGAGSAIEIGLFAGAFLRGIGVIHSTEWIVIVIIALVIAAMLAFAKIHVITRSLLFSELIGIVLVTTLSVVILVQLSTGNAPGGQSLNTHFLELPAGSGIGTIAAAAVFGFLAFAGFEGAAALGEETQNPRREIPRAIKIAIVVVGVFYLLTIVAQSLGYGTGPAAVKAFQTATSPYGALGSAYIGSAMADALNLVASISLFAILLATVAASARILFALARDAGGIPGLARLSRSGEPVTALVIVLALDLGIIVGQRIAGTTVLNATFYALTVGTIALLVAYLLATLGAVKFLFLGATPKAPRWQIILPLGGIAFVGYTIYKNVVGLSPPYSYFPYIIGIWLLAGLAVVLLSPGLAARVRRNLAESTNSDTAEPQARA
jgi:amino acid transporter